MDSCPLCKNTDIGEFYANKDYLVWQCSNCALVFKDYKSRPTAVEEKARYLTHNNDVDDPRYQAFVAPIVNAVIRDFENNTLGLDFGSGTGPVISDLLQKEGYSMNLYDPFFHPDRSALYFNYDFIVCCEVVEHFHDPANEFSLLRKILKPNGKLYIMTELLPKEVSFEDWYYKNDPTHVCFYSKENLEWIRKNMGFKELLIDGRLTVLSV